MKTKLLLIFGLLCCFFSSEKAHAQFGIDGISYQLKYNTDSCHYEALLIINAGAATSLAERRQFNANVSFVMPSASTYTVKRSYWPRTETGGLLPNYWQISTIVTSPAAAPSKKFVSVVPTLGANGGAQYYAPLISGDTIVLFSMNIGPITNCSSEIRMFENGVDPASTAAGMGGSDFNNGFTIQAAANQVYEDNATQLYPPSPVISDIQTTCGAGIFINLTASTFKNNTCQTPLTYAWTGPNGFTQNGTGAAFQDVTISPATAANQGNYKVIITDGMGCKDSVDINAYNKPNAGPDITVCAGTTTTVSGTSPNTGTWAPRTSPTNPPGATVSSLAAGQANITFTNGATGNYFFVYTAEGCTDTMRFTVNPKPTVGFASTPFICLSGGTSTITLTSNQTGTWVSNSPSIATINATTGVATAVAAGLVNFTFTNSTTGCQSTTNNLTIDPKPTVTQSTDTICFPGTANLTPTIGGTWTSTLTSVATVTNGGLVTAVAPGLTKLYFKSATGAMCTSDTMSMRVLAKPVATLATSAICVGATTNAIVTPSQVGTWTSTQPSIASVNNAGVILGAAAGTSTFIFTSAATGCISNPSAPLTVNAAPTVGGVPAGARCIGSTINLTPNTGGTWVSNNTSVATVNAATGLVTLIGQGTVNFTFTQTSTLCSATTINLVVSPQPVISATNATICVGTSTTLNANTAGTWNRIGSAPFPITYSASPSPTVTGVLAGTGKMRFVSSVTTCADTIDILVNPRPTVSITGNDSICIGSTTQLAPNSGGVWASQNNSIATVTPAGLVTGVAAGFTAFTYTQTSTGCTSDPTAPVTVVPTPSLTFSGPSGICVGNTTQVITTPVTTGTWTSSNTGVATINATTGLITGVAPGFSTLTFTEASLGCVITMSPNVSVFTKPTVSIDKSAVCIGQNAQLSPSSGGTWAKVPSGSGVANVTNAGLVTSLAAGTVQFVFTAAASSCPSDPVNFSVSAKPIVTNPASANICIGNTTTVTPNSGGVWSTSNATVATINNAGVITGVAVGIATFTFTSSPANCPSDPTTAVVVNGPPVIAAYPKPGICIGENITLTANTPGTWTSLSPAVATVNPATGVVTGVSQGLVFFTFLSSTTGCSATTATQLAVNPKPVTNLTLPTICVGKTTTITPSTQGSWVSTSPTVAAITNGGVITGLAAGTSTFVYTQTSTGCASDPSSLLTVTAGPDLNPPLDNELCIGETTTISPIGGGAGTWTTSNAAVATISNAGLITAIAPGLATFTFTDAAGCKSVASAPVIVLPTPTLTLNGPASICIGGLTDLNANTAGSWTALTPAIATIDAVTGQITGISAGEASFRFTSSGGCVANLPFTISVGQAPIIGIAGRNNICIGDTTSLFSNRTGVWTSNNPAVAIVDNDGHVKAIAPGYVTFTFAENGGGCSSATATDTLAIVSCIDPDFNVTYVNIPVNGDVSTNDAISVPVTYGTPIPTSNPSGSVFTITLNPDGTYTFVGDKVGVYIFQVPVCISPKVSGCETSVLTITVLDHLDPTKRPVANTDIATTKINTPVTLPTMDNDRCVVTTGCTLEPASVTVIDGPNRGTFVILPNGDITYTPNTGSTGRDTLTYQVCVTGEATNCATALQIITIEDTDAPNSTVAADDFNVTAENTPATGNVKDNDSDPQGNAQTVTAQTTTVPAGTLVLNPDGSYVFTPAPLFFGPVDFPYETCDNHPTMPVCDNATLHILVVPDMYIKIRVYLEGSLMNSTGTASDGRPLMRDNLRLSPFNGSRSIPNKDPYKYIPPQGNSGLEYDFISKFTEVGSGMIAKYDSVSVPNTVFAVTGQNAIVDWVFIELRNKTSNSTVLSTRAGLLQRDGDVVDIDGITPLKFPGMTMDNYYITVRHRSHLGIMSSTALVPKVYADLVDFTKIVGGIPTWDKGVQGLFDFTGLAQKAPDFKPNYYCMWAGDADGNGKVKFDAPGDDLSYIQSDVLFYNTNTLGTLNFDFAYGYLPGDYDMNGKSKFDNPNDDKNFLYAQVLLYPLNTQFFSNFDFVIQQLP